MTVITPRPEHEIAYQDIIALLTRHADALTSIEVLAIAANMLGKLVAMQDQRTVSQEMAMKVVARNIEMGNRHAVMSLMRVEGTA